MLEMRHDLQRLLPRQTLALPHPSHELAKQVARVRLLRAAAARLRLRLGRPVQLLRALLESVLQHLGHLKTHLEQLDPLLFDLMLLLERGRQQVWEEPDRKRQRKLHHRHEEEEGERDDAQQIAQHPHQQAVLAPREDATAHHLHQQLRGDPRVGGEQLAPVPVVRRHLLCVVPHPLRRPPRRWRCLLRLRLGSKRTRVKQQRRPAR
mmetsp:Transcript_6311/g.20215  ORF Transcript_6311/g.20215 Transcript_6311/m.20215 type:complete len:207 (-) Transcript_6311:151-771(-)